MLIVTGNTEVWIPACMLDFVHVVQIEEVSDPEQANASQDACELCGGTSPTHSSLATTSSTLTSIQPAVHLPSVPCEPSSNDAVPPARHHVTDIAAAMVSAPTDGQHNVRSHEAPTPNLQTGSDDSPSPDWHTLETAAAALSPAATMHEGSLGGHHMALVPDEEATPSASCRHNSSAGSSPTQLKSCLAKATSVESILPASCEDSQIPSEPVHANSPQSVTCSQSDAVSCTYASLPQPATHCVLSPSLKAAFSALPADKRPAGSAFPTYEHIQQSIYTRGVSTPQRRGAQEMHICDCSPPAGLAARPALGRRQSPWSQAGHRAEQFPFASPAAGALPARAQPAACKSFVSPEGCEEEQIAKALATVDSLVNCLSVDDSKYEDKVACGQRCLNRMFFVLCDPGSCGYGNVCRNK